MTPSNEIIDRIPDGCTVYSLHQEGNPSHLTRPGICKRPLFVGHNARKMPNTDPIPIALADIPSAMRNGTIPIDVAVVQQHPRSESLGLSVDVAEAAVQSADRVIIQSNVFCPRQKRSSFSKSKANCIMLIDEPLPNAAEKVADPLQARIARHVARIIPDGATIQLGIGSIAQEVANALKLHEDLSIWSEMISDSVIGLIDSGAVTGKVATSFVVGNRITDHLNRLDIEFLPIDTTNDFTLISGTTKMFAINNVVEIDYNGASVCDTVNGEYISGIGGQHDFSSAAIRSAGGGSIACLKSRTSAGKPRIVPELSASATIPKHLADWVVTENGAVNLRGKSMSERNELLFGLL